MPNQDVMGMIFPHCSKVTVGPFTTDRLVSALPFAGRYRLIDFVLSNMVNASIHTIAVCPVPDYTDLIKHLSAGKPWDLNRKYRGFSILPPKHTNEGVGEVDILYSHLDYIASAHESHVLLSYGNMIYNQPLQDFIRFHKDKGAQTTILYHKNPVTGQIPFSVTVNPEGQIQELVLGKEYSGPENIFAGAALFEKDFFLHLLKHCKLRNLHCILSDYIQTYAKHLNAYAYEAQGYMGIVNDVHSYYENQMNMLSHEIRNKLFDSNRPIFTRTRDSLPTLYADGAFVKHSLLADGCYIDGSVENSIISRGVHIQKGAIIKNSIILGNSTIAEDCRIENAILDENITLSSGRILIGDPSYPLTIQKDITI